jgi:hypothetical protein
LPMTKFPENTSGRCRTRVKILGASKEKDPSV